MRKLGLTAMGGICIFAGMMSQVIMRVIKPPHNRAELLGQGLAAIFFMLVGVVMIAIGLIKGQSRS